MKISLTIPDEFKITNHGYGVISQQVVLSLQRLGHEVPFQDRTAPIELAIGQPYHWNWSSANSYKIGYVAWESSEIPKNWWPGLRTAHEIWTPSPVIKKWFEKAGLKNVRVYQHGVDQQIWTRKRRRPTGPVKFLHIGEPAPRKGGQMVYDAFKEVFGNDSVASLTIKAHGLSTVRGDNSAHPYNEINNVKVIRNEYPEEMLVHLFKAHHVLVYPSYGEGFGLIPLQAMSTGMPVICTEAWAPYKDYLPPQLKVKSILGGSPWPDVHTGKMFYPSFSDVKDKLRFVVDNYAQMSANAYRASFDVEQDYDWDRLTEKAFAHL